MNSLLHGAALAARAAGIQLIGIKDAGAGLLIPGDPEAWDLLSHPTDCIAKKSGTILGSNTSGRKLGEGDYKVLRDNIQRLGIDAFAVVGGDGSVKYLTELFKKAGLSLPIMLAPKTIDNDMRDVDSCLGFDSAVEHNARLIETYLRTGESMHAVHIVQIMGRGCGDLALHSAAKSGCADIVLIPEWGYNMESVTGALQTLWNSGQRHAIIVVSEGIQASDGQELIVGRKEDGTPIMGSAGDFIKTQLVHALSGLPSESCFNPKSIRLQVFGHSQRGAEVSSRDRALGERLGKEVIGALLRGENGQVITHTGPVSDLKIVLRPIDYMANGIHESVHPRTLLKNDVSLGCETQEWRQTTFIDARRKRPPPAIDAFRRVTALRPNSVNHSGAANSTQPSMLVLEGCS